MVQTPVAEPPGSIYRLRVVLAGITPDDLASVNARKFWSFCVRPHAHCTSSGVGVNASASSCAETTRLNRGVLTGLRAT